MKEKKKMSKGGLNECPICKSSDISIDETEYVTESEMIQRIGCNNCSAQFTELWKAKNWEMVNNE